jgi:hypothetical protein
MKSINNSNIISVVLFVLLFAGCEKNSDDNTDNIRIATNGKGTLIKEEQIRVLKLTGTNFEMGYAHGYLLAEDIITVFNTLVPYIMAVTESEYEDLSALTDKMLWDNNYLDELEGMLAGIQDKLEPAEKKILVDGTSREIRLKDLQVYNATSEWGCSSFSVWGNSRNDSTLLFVRNFDYYTGSANEGINAQIIISYDDGVHNTWLSPGFCGFIGCTTGMNDHGMIMSVHDVNYYQTTDDQGYFPRCLLLRKLLETGEAEWSPQYIEQILDTFPLYTGMNLHVAFPFSGRNDDQVAAIIECDGNADHPDGRATLRLSSDNSDLYYNDTYDERVSNTHTLLCTNHYQLRREESIIGWSTERITIIKEGLAEAEDDEDVSNEEALDIMDKAGDYYTLHTLIFEPDNQLLHFYFEQADCYSFDAPVYSVKYDDLF